jgi:PhnB protein
MKVEPYLFFDGRCEEAIEFYKRTLGAKLNMMMRYKESPEKPPPGMVPPGSENKIMYSSLTIGESHVMAADHCGQGEKPKFGGFSLSLSASNEAEAKKFFNDLAEGGEVHMPLTKTFFSPCFGMLQDRFGVKWMVIVPGAA